MIVRCIENRRTTLPANIQKVYGATAVERMQINKEYVVYAIRQNIGFIEFYICSEFTESYPLSYPSIYFQVTNHLLSRYWIFTTEESNKERSLSMCLTFPEWASNPYFYDSLTDGDDEEVQIFRKYKALMNLEFPDLTIKEIAKIGDENWLLCPNCLDAWESKNTLDAMVICGNCQKMLHNPRYESVFPILPKG